MQKRKRILALDVGDVRVGVALSDDLQLTANPVTILERSKTLTSQLAELIKTQNVGTVIVGFPRRFDGSVGEQAEKSQNFAIKLQNYCNRDEELRDLQFVLLDERFTSQEADELLRNKRRPRSGKREHLDALSAAILLERYLSETE